MKITVKKTLDKVEVRLHSQDEKKMRDVNEIVFMFSHLFSYGLHELTTDELADKIVDVYSLTNKRISSQVNFLRSL